MLSTLRHILFLTRVNFIPYSQKAKAGRGQLAGPGPPASKWRSWVCTRAARGQGLHTLCLPLPTDSHTHPTHGDWKLQGSSIGKEKEVDLSVPRKQPPGYFQWKRRTVCCTLPFKFTRRDDMHACTCVSEWFSRIYKEPFITVSSGTENKGLRWEGGLLLIVYPLLNPLIFFFFKQSIGYLH